MSSTEVAATSPRRWVRILLTVVCLGFAAFWIWALFFASKESVNRIGDSEWANRAQAICERANEERIELADFTRIDGEDRSLLAQRADVVDEATGILEQMVDELIAVPPADEKGAEIVPMWIEDYRTYLQDRHEYTERLRDGENVPFSETAVEGIPISEKLTTFASDNEMEACAPPRDLSM